MYPAVTGRRQFRHFKLVPASEKIKTVSECLDNTHISSGAAQRLILPDPIMDESDVCVQAPANFKFGCGTCTNLGQRHC
jgi:hypothetical protein